MGMHACSLPSPVPLSLSPSPTHATQPCTCTHTTQMTVHRTHVDCVVEDGAQRLKVRGRALPHLGALLGGKVQHAQEGLVALLACASALRGAASGKPSRVQGWMALRLDQPAQGVLLRGEEAWRAQKRHGAQSSVARHKVAPARSFRLQLQPGQHTSTTLYIPHLHEQLPLALELCQHIPEERRWERGVGTSEDTRATPTHHLIPSSLQHVRAPCEVKQRALNPHCVRMSNPHSLFQPHVAATSNNKHGTPTCTHTHTHLRSPLCAARQW